MAASAEADGKKSSSSSSSSSNVVKPYWLFRNPYLSWIDIILELIFTFLVPVARLAKNGHYTKNGERELQWQRSNLDKMSDGTEYSETKKWKKLRNGEDIIQVKLSIPRDPHILSQCGVISPQNKLYQQFLSSQEPSSEEEQTSVIVFLRFPISILTGKKQEELRSSQKEKNKFGCIEWDETALFDIATMLPDKNVPIVLWCHGGGQIIGSPHDGNGLQFLNDVLQEQMKVTSR